MLPSLCLFGEAGSDGSAPAGFVFKLMGREESESDYCLVLEVTNGTQSYCTRFSLASLIRQTEDEAAVEPTPANMLDWLREHFDAGEVEAVLGAGGRLQLEAQHHWGSYAINIRLPPGDPMAPLEDPKRAAWVVQELLFTQAAWGRGLARRLDACQQRCPLEQQFEDLLAFLAAGSGGQAGAAAAAAAAGAAAAAIDGGEGDGDSGGKDGNGKAGCAGGSPVAPRAAHIVCKRKLQELEAAAAAAAAGGAPASGSAVKAPRPGTQAAGPGAASLAGAQPASTQQTGGASNATQRTDVSEIGKPKVIHRPKPGRGRGATQIGRARR
ncbi:hypothetical protein ABPG75_013412 [Micractinium tetrahymenae]